MDGTLAGGPADLDEKHGGNDLRDTDDSKPSGTETARGLRLDIQGVRALAIVLVVFAHAGVPGLAGGFIGIDVFFVVSGFLITGLLAREAETKGRISLRNFYARRARRLLPLAAIVLVLTAIGTLILYSPTEQVTIGTQIVGAALYFVNWIFAFQEVDYFTAGTSVVSPVQHFWSLSVEEQFYLTWPLLMIGATGLALKFGHGIRKTSMAVLVPIALASLAYSVVITESNPEMAYFSSLTRIWELAFGAILALALPRSLDMPGWLSGLLVGGGLIAVIACALTFDEGGPFPGWQALVPVFGTMAILLGGTAQVRSVPARVLCLRPVQYLGNVSYAWYLWHWPLLIFALVIWPDLGLLPTIAIGIGSLIPSAISHTLVENPIRFSPALRRLPVRSLAIGALASVTAATGGIALANQKTPVEIIPADEAKGAKVIETPGEVPFEPTAERITPDPLYGVKDRGKLFYEGCMAWDEEVELPECTFGDRNSETSVVLFGDSKPMSWFPAIEPIADRRGWKLVGLTRGNCVVADVTYEEKCDEWRENMMERIPTEEPDLIILGTATKAMYTVEVGGKRLSRIQSQPYLVEGMAKTIERLKEETGAQVVMIRDQVLAPIRPPDCVSANLNSLERCVYKPRRRPALAFELEAARLTGTRTIDPLPMICSRMSCPPVVGDVLVNQDNYHVTATYAATMSEWMAGKLPRNPAAQKRP